MRKFIKTFSKIVSFLWILLIFIPIAIIYTLSKQVPSRFYKELNLIDYETPLTRDYFEIESVLEMETYDKDSRVKVYKTSSIYDTFNHRFVKSIAVDENENVAVLQEHYPGIAGVSIFNRDWNFICGYTIIWWEGEYIEWNSECLNIVKSNNRFVSIDIDNDTFALGYPVNESFYPYAQNEYNFKGGTLKLANKEDEEDIKRGIEVGLTLGKLDVGQSVVIQQGLVLGVEGIEGTDKLILRCADYKRKGKSPILVKLRKPTQDMRVDLPTIGVKTVENAYQSGFSGIAIHEGNTLVVNQEEVVALANKYKMFIKAITPTEYDIC